MKKKTKKEIKEERDWKKMMTRIRNLEFLGGFFYDAYGGEMLTVCFYDKKRKTVFGGTLKLSSYNKKEILSREYSLKKKTSHKQRSAK